MLLKSSVLIGDISWRQEYGRRLLDHTMVLYGSDFGNANIHDCTNLPVILVSCGSGGARLPDRQQPAAVQSVRDGAPATWRRG